MAAVISCILNLYLLREVCWAPAFFQHLHILNYTQFKKRQSHLQFAASQLECSPGFICLDFTHKQLNSQYLTQLGDKALAEKYKSFHPNSSTEETCCTHAHLTKICPFLKPKTNRNHTQVRAAHLGSSSPFNLQGDDTRDPGSREGGGGGGGGEGGSKTPPTDTVGSDLGAEQSTKVTVRNRAVKTDHLGWQLILQKLQAPKIL